MQSVIFIAPRIYDFELRNRLERLGPLMPAADGILVLEEEGSRVYVGKDDSVCDDFDAEELEYIHSVIPEPVFYYVDFSDIALCRKVLESIADDTAILIDNDFGLCIRGSEFIKLLRDRPHWNWLIEPLGSWPTEHAARDPHSLKKR
jgi:hypothetical protein